MNLSSHEPLQTLSGHLMWQVHFRQTGNPVLTLLRSREPVAVVANEAAEAVAFGCVLSLAASSFWRNSCRAFCAYPKIIYTKNGLRTSKARSLTYSCNDEVKLVKEIERCWQTWYPPWSPSCQSADGDGGLLADGCCCRELRMFLSKEILFGIAPVAFGFSDWMSWETDFCTKRREKEIQSFAFENCNEFQFNQIFD